MDGNEERYQEYYDQMIPRLDDLISSLQAGEETAREKMYHFVYMAMSHEAVYMTTINKLIEIYKPGERWVLLLLARADSASDRKGRSLVPPGVLPIAIERCIDAARRLRRAACALRSAREGASKIFDNHEISEIEKM